MRLSIRVFGREVLAVDHEDQPPPPADHEGQAASVEEHPPPGFGFYGGSGGTQQTAWQPVTDRPVIAE